MRTLKNRERGFVLVLSLLYIFLIAAFLTAILVVVASGLRQVNRLEDNIRAYYAADAGLANAFMQLRAASVPPASFSVPNNAGGTTAYAVGPGLNGTYRVEVTTANPNAAWPIYTLVSTGTFGNATKTLTLRVQASSFTRWFYLSNTETWSGIPLWWVTGMTTEGPVYTNGQFNILGDPISDGSVSQVSSTINYYHGGPPNDNPDFRQGLNLRAPAISFPTTELLASIKGGAQQAGGLFFTGNTAVEFISDGTIKVTNSSLNSGTPTTMALPANNALYVENGNVSVKGTLKGQLTVASNRDVRIDHIVRYNTDPRINPESTDMLGLVARNNVIVTSNAPALMEINAYMVALTGSFQAEDYRTRPTGEMVQFGGFANNTNGPTGTVYSNGTFASGYNQLMFYDGRFHNTTPPWFVKAKDSSNRILYYKLDLTES